MKRTLALVVGASLASTTTSSCAPKPAVHGQDSPEARAATACVTKATDVIRLLRESSDVGIPRTIARGARCVAIVPELIHAGLVLGARAGRGVVTCRTQKGWTDPSFFVINGASAGLQAGIQTVDLVMLAMTDASAQAFLAGKLQLGASSSFAAGPVGRSAEASSDVTARVPVLCYSRARGLFAGLDLAGTTVDADEEASRAFYGDPRDFGVLLRGTRAVPPAALALRAEIERIFATEASE